MTQTVFARFLPALAMLWITVGTIAQDIPRTLSYQGYLTNASGTPVEQVLPISFSLYAAQDGGEPLWSDTQTVVVTGGLFSVDLGSDTAPLPADLPDGSLFLGISVNGDPEMLPRRALRASPYALRAENADTLAGATVDDIVALVSNGSTTGGSAVPVLVADFDGDALDLTTSQLSIDGSGFEIEFPMFSLPRWDSLVLELVYPAGQPSPLGTTEARLTYNDLTLRLADSPSSEILLRGTQAVAESVAIEVDSSTPGATQLRERLELTGTFTFTQISAPDFNGAVQVELGGDVNRTITATAAGPWTVSVDIGPGGGGVGQPVYGIAIDGLGPEEVEVLLNLGASGDRFPISLSTGGTALPGADNCRPESITGLTPAVVDVQGAPVSTIQFGRATFECFNSQP